jgi:leader peptidase (prepilin peptidase)/N-methyltransferase
MLTALQLGANGDALWALVALWLLIAMAGIDAEHQLLPDLLVYPLLWLGLLRAALGHAPITASDAIFAAFFAYLALWSLMHLHQMLRKVQGMGHGDFKLAAALGAWLGPMQLPFLLLLAAVLGLLWVTFMRVRSQSLQRVAFGPFLALSGWSLLVWPESLLQILTLGSLQ